MASKHSPDSPQGYKRAPRSPFVTARNHVEYRLSVLSPAHHTWSGGYAQVATVDSGEASQRDVMFDRHAFMMALHVEGSRTLVRVDGAEESARTLRVGDVTYLPPGHHLNSTSWGICQFITVLLDPVLTGTASEDFRKRPPVILSSNEAALAAILFRTATALARAGGPDASEVESLCSLLLDEVQKPTAEVPMQDATPVRRAWHSIRPVLEHIERQIDTRLPLEELASVANLSLSQTARVAKTFLGTSLHRYVLSRRIARACDLLANTDLPVSEIAALTGLSSQSHLTSLLSDNIGRSPASYRRAQQPRSSAPR